MQTFPSHYSLRHLLGEYRSRRRPLVLAVVVATHGSSYRKRGALALIDAQGLVSGCISGGCLEAELVAAAQHALESASNARLCLDTRADDDRWFGSQSGCRGTVELLLVPSASDGAHPLLDALVAADSAHRSLELQVDLASQPPCWEFGAARGVPGTQELQRRSATLQEPEPQQSRASALVRVSIAPTPRVLLLGGGPEAPPLIELAQTLGWWLEVAEQRARYLAQARLTAADRVHCMRPTQLLQTIDVGAFDAVICAAHLFDEDRACLAALAGSSVSLIGVLGPASRGAELLAELDPECRAALADRLQAPIGVALGAYGPEAVALSIAARLTEAFARG